LLSPGLLSEKLGLVVIGFWERVLSLFFLCDLFLLAWLFAHNFENVLK
jgi:uncharacterized membrane protein YphA (DoxX/SURF4 family)